MPLPLPLGLQDYRFLPMEGQARYPIDFGTIPIFRQAKFLLSLRNNSSLEASYSFHFENFGEEEYDPLMEVPPTRASTSLSENNGKGSQAQQMRLLLKETHERRTGFQTKNTTENDDSLDEERDLHILQRGNGVAFTVVARGTQLSSGILQPFEQVALEITCYNNMCGTFEDTLHVEVCVIMAVPTTCRWLVCQGSRFQCE